MAKTDTSDNKSKKKMVDKPKKDIIPVKVEVLDDKAFR